MENPTLELATTIFGRYSIAVVTPFTPPNEDGVQSIDFGLLEIQLNRVCIRLNILREYYEQIGGIIVSGTTGEQHSMDVAEKCELYAFAAGIGKRHGIPIIAGISTTVTSFLTRLVHSAVGSGCQGIMLGIPPYIRASDEELADSYVGVVRQCVPKTFPVLLYNNIMRNGYGPSLPIMADWYRRGYICGVKYAVAPHEEFLRQTTELLRLCPKLRLYTGSDVLCPGLLLNPAGTEPDDFSHPQFYGLTSIVGNLFPFEMGVAISRICNSVELKDPTTMTPLQQQEHGLSLHAKLIPVSNAVLVGLSVPVGIKFGLTVLGAIEEIEEGLRGGEARAPLGKISHEKKDEIRSLVQQYVECSRT